MTTLNGRRLRAHAACRSASGCERSAMQRLSVTKREASDTMPTTISTRRVVHSPRLASTRVELHGGDNHPLGVTWQRVSRPSVVMSRPKQLVDVAIETEGRLSALGRSYGDHCDIREQVHRYGASGCSQLGEWVHHCTYRGEVRGIVSLVAICAHSRTPSSPFPHHPPTTQSKSQ
jgi:hypothetical protein